MIKYITKQSREISYQDYVWCVRSVNNLEFAIYKYSSEAYDPEEFFFPEMECIDRMVHGAMRASLLNKNTSNSQCLQKVI